MAGQPVGVARGLRFRFFLFFWGLSLDAIHVSKATLASKGFVHSADVIPMGVFAVTYRHMYDKQRVVP